MGSSRGCNCLHTHLIEGCVIVERELCLDCQLLGVVTDNCSSASHGGFPTYFLRTGLRSDVESHFDAARCSACLFSAIWCSAQCNAQRSAQCSARGSVLCMLYS